jgi:DNA polymerase III subunit delta'
MPFRDIVGHRHLLELMAQAAVRETLPPSLIFAGPDGVGKRQAAVALAQLLNCQFRGGAKGSAEAVALQGLPGRSAKASAERTTSMFAGDEAPDACGVCASCTRIARGVQADVLLVEPDEAGSIKIDQVRAAIERAGYRPFEGRRRIVIIDNAAEMVEPAQNALLKTLEEPPATSVFILVTSRPDVLLPTVRSRCQRLRFGRLGLREVADALISAHGYSEADARVAAALADGSIGRALDGASGELVEAREAAARLLESLADTKDPARRLESALGLPGAGRGKVDRDKLAGCLWSLSSILRDVGILVSRADERSLANPDLRPLLQRLVRSYETERLMGAFAAVDRALDALDRNASPKIVADWLAFQI